MRKQTREFIKFILSRFVPNVVRRIRCIFSFVPRLVLIKSNNMLGSLHAVGYSVRTGTWLGTLIGFLELSANAILLI